MKRSEVERLVKACGDRLLSYDDKDLRAYIRAVDKMRKAWPAGTVVGMDRACDALDRAKVRLLGEVKRG